MIVLLRQLARDLPGFAPDLVSDPRVCLFRIYRDTRFSSDKRPLKTNVAVYFPSLKFPKGEGAGMYIEVAPQWVWMGGGIYMPSAGELHAIRAAIADPHRRFRRVVTAPAFRRAVGELSGEQLTRVPRGYLIDLPAAEFLRHRQFIGGREYPADFSVNPRFYSELLTVFRGIAPLVGFLNHAIISGTNGTREFVRSLAG